LEGVVKNERSIINETLIWSSSLFLELTHKKKTLSFFSRVVGKIASLPICPLLVFATAVSISPTFYAQIFLHESLTHSSSVLKVLHTKISGNPTLKILLKLAPDQIQFDIRTASINDLDKISWVDFRLE
jgi:hypothetical protein